MKTAADRAIDAIAGARHADPFSVLGPHLVERGLCIRAMLPGAEQVSVVRPEAEPARMERQHRGGRVRNRARRRARDPRLPAGGDVPRRTHRAHRRPVSLRARPRRLRSLSVRRGKTHPASTTSSAPIRYASAPPTASTSRSGPPTRGASASSVISTAGMDACIPCGHWARAACGRFHPGRACRPSLQVRAAFPERPDRSSRSIPMRPHSRCHRCPRR